MRVMAAAASPFTHALKPAAISPFVPSPRPPPPANVHVFPSSALDAAHTCYKMSIL